MTWFVAHTQPRSEEIARLHLERQGFDVFLPRCRREVRHARRVAEVCSPLFPRYLFVGLDPERQRWRSVNGTHGVVYLISDKDRPLPVAEEVVAGLMARCDQDGFVPVVERQRQFAEGEQLRILAGPLADHVGVFQRVDERQRVTLLLQLLARPVLVKVPAEALASAG